MKAYLRIDPVFADQFSDVWLWNEWPGNGGKHDTGIDLVAAGPQHRPPGRDPVQVLRADHHGLQADDRLLPRRRRARTGSRSGSSSPPPTSGTPTPRTRSRTSSDPGTPDRAQRPGALPGRLGAVLASRLPRVLPMHGKKTPRPHQRDRDRQGDRRLRRDRPRQADHGLRHRQDLHLAAARRGERRRRRQGALPGARRSRCSPRRCASGSARPSVPIRPLAVCSDAKSTKRSANTDEDISTTDLALPATTNVDAAQAAARRRRRRHRGDDGRLRDLPVDRRRRPGARRAARRST